MLIARVLPIFLASAGGAAYWLHLQGALYDWQGIVGFASCPGVSKIGVYSGNGGSVTINTGLPNVRSLWVFSTTTSLPWAIMDIYYDGTTTQYTSFSNKANTVETYPMTISGGNVTFGSGNYNTSGQGYGYIAFS